MTRKDRGSRPDSDTRDMTINEKFMRDIHNLYNEEEFDQNGFPSQGVLHSAKDLEKALAQQAPNVTGKGSKEEAMADAEKLRLLLPPREKVTLLIIGNHSAGKSSFINWYIGEEILKANMAIETSNVTFITRGKKKTKFLPDMMMDHYTFLPEFVKKVDGVEDHMELQVCTSSERQFPMLDVIDTPGLIDGSFRLSFDVKHAIEELAHQADLIFVFMDPQKQATVSSTMKVVNKLDKELNFGKRMHYFITMADQMKDEKDRGRVLQQCSTQLAANVQDTHSLKIYTIYLPDRQSEAPNEIDELCKIVSDQIQVHMQIAMRTLKKDMDMITGIADRFIARNKTQRASWSTALIWKALVGFISALALILGIFAVLGSSGMQECPIGGFLCSIFNVANGISSQMLGTILVTLMTIVAGISFAKCRVPQGAPKDALKKVEQVVSDMSLVKERHALQKKAFMSHNIQ